MLKQIDKPDTVSRSEIINIINTSNESDSNMQNTFYKKKILAGSLALYISILPISNTITQSNNDFYGDDIHFKYEENRSNLKEKNIEELNKFVFEGNNYISYDNIKHSNYSVINLNELSYTNPKINLQESFKDVNNMINQRRAYKNVKNKINTSYRAENIVEDLGYYEENENEELTLVARRKIKIQGKIKSVKRTTGVLV